MVNNVMSELGAINEKVGVATTKGFERITNAVEPCVRRAQHEGDIDSNFSPKEIAALLHSTFYGVLTRAKSLGNYKNGIKTMDLLFTNLKIKWEKQRYSKEQLKSMLQKKTYGRHYLTLETFAMLIPR